MGTPFGGHISRVYEPIWYGTRDPKIPAGRVLFLIWIYGFPVSRHQVFSANTWPVNLTCISVPYILQLLL